MGVATQQNMIAGVALHARRVISDERGAVLHMLRNDDDSFHAFGEVYFSEVMPAMIKAWKRHARMTQMLAVPIGLVKFVVYDEREVSSTRGQINEFILGRPDDYHLLQIPAQVWYGFQCLSDSSALIANCADRVHVMSEVERKACDSTEIPYQW